VVTGSDPDVEAHERIRVIRDPTGELHERYGATQPRLYLIRPDGYVALRSENPDRLTEYLAAVR
jgi:hypothetical protein